MGVHAVAGRAAMTGYDPSQAQAPTGGLGRTSLADFALNYDRDAPVRAIDQGGADQEAQSVPSPAPAQTGA
jgi:hypothetical protein